MPRSYQCLRTPGKNLAARRPFGYGIFAQTDRIKLASYTAADAEFIKGECPPDAMEDGESYAAFLDDTLSPGEYRSLMEEVARMSGERDAMAALAFEDAARGMEADGENLMLALADAYDAEMASHGFADELYAAISADGPLDDSTDGYGYGDDFANEDRPSPAYLSEVREAIDAAYGVTTLTAPVSAGRKARRRRVDAGKARRDAARLAAIGGGR